MPTTKAAPAEKAAAPLADRPMPKTLAACADEFYRVMTSRFAKQKEVDELQKRETALKDYLIEQLPISQATGVSGKVCSVKIVKKTRPQVESWDEYWAYVYKLSKKDPSSGLAMMQRRVSDSAINELWADKKTVPGVKAVEYKTVSYSAVK